ncbi:hypothetical protein TI39_contig86g00005 [Zymoseptoria brevis]|uniref:Uncharacterized protein n=1 Tax=Zymoseptoria brevis TaxID=1047168 RepID=A0A0F4GYR9_9PEZI|nr:hypothetical protein TI39_contig86g00005 [Zymoseptoria brevis]
MADAPHPLFRLPAELYDEVFNKMRALSTAIILLANKQFSNHYRAALERRKNNFAVHRASVLIKTSDDKTMSRVQTFMHPLSNASRSANIDLELPECASALHLSITVDLPFDFHCGGSARRLFDCNDITAPLKAIINGTNSELILLDVKFQDSRNLDWRGQNKDGYKLHHGAFIPHDRTGTFVHRDSDESSSSDTTSDFIQGDILSKPGEALLDFFRAEEGIGRAFVEGPGDNVMPGHFLAELCTGPISKATLSMDFGFVISVDALLGEEPNP